MNVMERFSLNHRVVVITGASSGLGRGIAVACAQAGATVVAIGRNASKLATLQNELAEYGNASSYHIFDVTDYEKIPDLIAAITAEHGKIGGFVHSAGIADTIPLRMMTARDYERFFAVNVIAGFEFVRGIARKQYADAELSIVFIASMAGLRGTAGMSGYGASKGAVIAGVKSLAAELGPKGIRVNSIAPGFVADTKIGTDTLLTLPEEALNRFEQKHLLGFGRAEDLPCGAIYLLSSASRWVTGCCLVIDGGYCVR